MKKVLKFCMLVAVAMTMALTLNAQQSASAHVYANIVTPIAISKTIDMNFGNIATNGSVGTVSLSPTGVRTAGIGVILPATTGLVNAAQFEVSGAPNYTYSVNLPNAAVHLSAAAGVQHMIVDNFVSNPSTTGQLDATGKSVLSVGATLNLNANQPAGQYTSTNPFVVIVNYN